MNANPKFIAETARVDEAAVKPMPNSRKVYVEGRIRTRQQMLEFIQSFLSQHGYPPSIRDIGAAVGISSTSVVDYNLNVLEKAGYIRRDREISRGIELLGEEPERHPTFAIPIVGQIAAGEPIVALEGQGQADLFECLSGNRRPESGEILVQGKSRRFSAFTR